MFLSSKRPLAKLSQMKKIAEDFSTILLKLLPSCKNIGFSWGKIIHDGLEILSEKENHYEAMPNTSVFPLAGSMITTGYSVDAQKIVQTFAMCFASVPNFLYAPAFLESPMELELYQKTENFRNISGLWENIDLAVIKIDNYPTSPDLGTAARYQVLLKEKHACGSFLPTITICTVRLSARILIIVSRFRWKLWPHAKQLSAYVLPM